GTTPRASRTGTPSGPATASASSPARPRCGSTPSAAASWTARTWLGLPGLVPGAPADAVLYDRDPRTDLGVLDRPTAVILRGRRVRPRI
ncbi:amidohydrolase family protein, partial [Streptomyces sp. S6]